MPLQKPSSFSISMSYSVRWRMRCASSIRPSASNARDLLLELVPDLVDRSLDVGFEVTYSVAGQIARLSSCESTSPVSGSKCEICSTSSPNSEIRYAVSAFAGCTSTTSPRTRKRPRASTVSLRTYCESISVRSISSRSCSVADLEDQHALAPLLRRAEAVDARHARDDDDVAPREERARRAEPKARDVVVLRGVLLDVEVGLRDVRLGLVVVVVGDEVLDRVLGEELAELVAELRGERLVVGDHERRALELLHHPGHRRRLAGAGRAEERLAAVAPRGATRRAPRSRAAGRRSGDTRM